MREYQIPRNVSAKFEFWPGFGWVELFIAIAGILIGLAFRYLSLTCSHRSLRRSRAKHGC